MAVRLLKRNHRAGSPGLRSRFIHNAYLTDESRLFRCLGWDGRLVVLEDCASLEAFAFPADELAAAGLRPVEPARAR
jgi:hypothetical protein